MKDACVILDGANDYTVIGYEHIEYINVTSKLFKLSTIKNVFEYREIYFKNEDGLYMGIEDAIEYIKRLESNQIENQTE